MYNQHIYNNKPPPLLSLTQEHVSFSHQNKFVCRLWPWAVIDVFGSVWHFLKECTLNVLWVLPNHINYIHVHINWKLAGFYLLTVCISEPPMSSDCLCWDTSSIISWSKHAPRTTSSGYLKVVCDDWICTTALYHARCFMPCKWMDCRLHNCIYMYRWF